MGMIRIALAFAVLLGHLPVASFHFMGAGLAVQSFFIVSGFYMALVLDGKYQERGLFYSNRLLRLMPGYFLMMLVSAVALFAFEVSATASTDLFRAAYAHPASALILASENLGLLGQELLYWFRLGSDGLLFDASGAPPSDASPVAWQALLVPQSWSLSMEWMFYLLAPFLVRMNLMALAGIAAASLALRFSGHLLALDYSLWQGRLFPTALFLFLFGVLAYRLLPLARKTPAAARIGIALGTLALIIWQPRLGLADEPGRCLVYVVIALATPFIFAQFQHNPLDRFIGELSYPIYLCHLFIVAVVLTWEPPQAMWVAFGLTLLMAVSMLLLVDRPIDAWRQRRVKPSL